MTMSEQDEYLYHFTTPRGLIGIVTEKNLWATDIFYLNDRTEFRHGLEIALKEIREGRVHDRYRSYVSEAVDILSRLRGVPPDLGTQRIYVFSLTPDPDQLSQWLSYCPHGGYAIGFPLKALRDTMDAKHIRLVKCCYSPEEKQRMVQEYLTEVPHYVPSSIQGDSVDDLVGLALAASVTLKDEGLSTERECRLVYLVAPADADTPLTTDNFRSCADMIIPYQKIELSPDLLRRARVYVGPCHYPDESAAAAGRLLRCGSRAEFEQRVVKSRLPYRSL
jgi:hypothetical protein